MFDFLTAVMAGWITPRVPPVEALRPRRSAAPLSNAQIVAIANLSAQR